MQFNLFPNITLTHPEKVLIYEGLGDNANLYVKNDCGYYGHAFANI